MTLDGHRYRPLSYKPHYRIRHSRLHNFVLAWNVGPNSHPHFLEKNWKNGMWARNIHKLPPIWSESSHTMSWYICTQVFTIHVAAESSVVKFSKIASARPENRPGVFFFTLEFFRETATFELDILNFFIYLVIFHFRDPGGAQRDHRYIICRRTIETNTESVPVQPSAFATELGRRCWNSKVLTSCKLSESMRLLYW